MTPTPAQLDPVYMCSRRTIMDGEVVTFATGFRPPSKGAYEPTGPFEVSASRNQVIVHRAWLSTPEQHGCFIAAVNAAYAAMWALRIGGHHGGAPSKYPSKPTIAGACRALGGDLDAVMGGGE